MIFLWLQLLAVAAALVAESKGDILAKPVSLIYFHAPDCRYCLEFNSQFEYLSALYSDQADFQAVKVDGRKHRDLVQLFQVQQFPTLKLYDDVNKQVRTYSEARLVENIQQFLYEHAGVSPDFSKVESGVLRVDSLRQVEQLAAEKPVMLLFISDETGEWLTLHYPSHFYQELAAAHPHVTFAYATMALALEVLQHYEVSNTPLAVFLVNKRIGVYNTHATNHISGGDISAEPLRALLAATDGKYDGLWFDSRLELAEYVETRKYDGHLQWKGGMNAVDARQVDGSLDEQYEKLLEAVGLY